MPKAQSTLSIWLLVWSVVLALGWLLPNHYRPWTLFHTEAWVAFVLMMIVPWAVLRSPVKFSVDAFVLAILAMAAIPFIQLAFGQIAYFGHAWIGSLYPLGLAVAILAGYFWEKSNSGRLMDMLCLAIGMASLFSVCLQFYQWLELDGLGIWLADANRNRPAANLGHPNHLATFLLWGVLAAFWAWVRSIIGAPVAILMALFLLFGVALTGSRAALLAVVLVIAAGWWWRSAWRSKYVPWVLTAMGCYVVACSVILKQYVAQTSIAGSLSDVRLAAWRQLVSAVLDSPSFGCGWDQTASAYILVSEKYPALHVVFGHAHNLFLDLILWCGLPVGAVLSWIILRRFWRVFRQANSPESMVLFLFLLVVANHALLEFPLYYAYFLLPAGLILGTLFARDHGGGPGVALSRWGFAVLGVVSAMMLSITLIDYLKVENSYSNLRLEWAGFKLEANPQPPRVIALNQWHHILKHARIVPGSGVSESELEDMRQVTLLAHKPIDFRVLASTLFLNGKVPESQLWLQRMCNVGAETSCAHGEFPENP